MDATAGESASGSTRSSAIYLAWSCSGARAGLVRLRQASRPGSGRASRRRRRRRPPSAASASPRRAAAQARPAPPAGPPGVAQPQPRRPIPPAPKPHSRAAASARARARWPRGSASGSPLLPFGHRSPRCSRPRSPCGRPQAPGVTVNWQCADDPNRAIFDLDGLTIRSASSDNSIAISRRSKRSSRVAVRLDGDRIRRHGDDAAVRRAERVLRRMLDAAVGGAQVTPDDVALAHVDAQRARDGRGTAARRSTAHASRPRDSAENGRTARVRGIDRSEHAHVRHRSGRHGQDVSRRRDGGARAARTAKSRGSFSRARRSKPARSSAFFPAI